MKSIPRRRFLKQAGQATTFAYLGTNLTAASGRIALIADPGDKLISSQPVQWAIGELRQAVEAKGATCVTAATPSDAGDFSLGIMMASEASSLPSEGFRVTPQTIS